MATRKKIETNHEFEFELDLAPLLAVMVKLVPVLLVSSAFVNLMVIETELPQAIQQQIQENKENEKSVQIHMNVSNQGGIKIDVINENGSTESLMVQNAQNGEFDFKAVNKTLVGIKLKHPDVFKLTIYPEGNVNYKHIIKLMDQARKSGDANIKFPIFDKSQNKKVMTDYMFPDVTFGNIIQG